MIPQFPFHRQLGELDCGVTCLKMIIDYFGKPISFEQLQNFLPIHDEGVSLKDISDAASEIGLKTMGIKVPYKRLVEEIPTPCIAFWKQQHFVVIYHVNDEYVWIADPATRGIYVQSKESFQEGWICDSEFQSGVLLLFEKTPAFSESKKPMDLALSI
ncbi:MAG: cysteine peptidase family C39 domain-containing protein [Saprospiraceae bacterium]